MGAKLTSCWAFTFVGVETVTILVIDLLVYSNNCGGFFKKLPLINEETLAIVARVSSNSADRQLRHGFNGWMSCLNWQLQQVLLLRPHLLPPWYLY